MNPATDRFIYLMEKEIEDKRTLMEAGLCSDYVVYRSLVSEIKAHRFAVELLKKVYSEDDDEE